MSTSETPSPMVDATPARGTPVPRKTSALAKGVVALALIALSVPVGAKIKASLAKNKALEDDRTKTAQSAAAKSSGPLSVKITHGEPTTWTPSVPFDGTLQPIQEASLAFKATGPLAQLKVKTGDYVKKGTLLGALDATEAYAQSKVASAQIAASKAQLSLAKDNADLTAAMVKSGATPGVKNTEAKGQLDLASAQLEGAEAQLALSGALINNHRLVAPFDGWVTSAPSAMGGLVVAGNPVFVMKDTSRLRLVGTVSELDASLVKIGAEVAIHLQLVDKTVNAKVTMLLPTVDPATRRIPVEAQLENDEKDPILAGSFVRAKIAGGSALSVIKLPASALRPGAQDEILIVENDKLRVAKIVFTRGSDGSLLVRSGLTAKDAVLANPSPEAKDGEKVSVQE